MARKVEKKQKSTDSEQHRRFVEMAREVEASDDPKDFDRAFKTIARLKTTSGKHPTKRSNSSEEKD